MDSDESKPIPKRQPDFEVPGWKNPYVLYVVGVAALFGFLLLMAYLAYTNGWIPTR